MRSLLVLLALALLAACQGVDEPQPQPVEPVERTEPAEDPTEAPTEEPTEEPTEASEVDDVPVAERLAGDPEGLAVQVGELERQLRDPGLEVGDLADAGHLQQLVYRTVADEPEWREPFLAAVDDEVREAVEGNLHAVSQLRGMTDPGEELPDWRIVEPAPAEELLDHYRAAEAEFGVHWSYLAAIHLVETRMGRIRGTSVAGAQGPMQFMPGTWEQYGEGDVEDDRDAIMAAGRYLAASGAPDDMDAAIFAYNRHTYYVDAVRAYAARMQDDELALRGYYHWQVYYRLADGDVLLPVGYGD